MVQYNLKNITVVPNAKEMVDIVLSRTQRQTPTVVHKGDPISRLRKFYTRKVKYTQQNFHDKLSAIIEEFPRLVDIHPFYSDLLHVLYNRDHYKLALGQVSTARSLISKIAKDYIRLLRYGDSLYRCKCLKVAGIGRMCTVIKRIGPSLAYLEQVRQHMGRLPCIDPNARTVVICGCPNVGKSSFVNKVTRADVEVQPYAFTTKSLFVGHMDYKYLRYQVVDTPGLLDRPLEDRNVVEMCSVTALAHLRAAVLFFLDVSGSCGYSIAQQAALFHSVKSLFLNKPLIVVCSKADLHSIEGVSEEDQRLIMEMKEEALKTSNGEGEGEGVLLSMSALTEEGVIAVKNAACERLLDQRVELKMKSRKINECLNRFHVAMPKARDQKERPACIPQGVLEANKANNEARVTEREMEDENGGAGVYSVSLNKHYVLANDEWKEDIMPEFVDGHNVYDFVDPDILHRLEELETEEEFRVADEAAEDCCEMNDEELTADEREALSEIRRKKSVLIQKHRMKKSSAGSRPVVPRKFDKDRKFTAKRMGRKLSEMGLDPSAAVGRACSKSRGRKRQRRSPEIMGAENDVVDVDVQHYNKKQRGMSMSQSRLRSQSRPPNDVVLGVKDLNQKCKAVKLANKSSVKRNKDARMGEADRVIANLKPKHLFSGKRSTGKTDRR